MDSVSLLLIISVFVAPSRAVYDGPLQPEITNGTFHHFFVPDGDYDATEDPEECQMLFKLWDVSPCGATEDRDSGSMVREDFIITKLQQEDSARLLESIERTVTHDLDGEESYGRLLQREILQISEAFSSVDLSLQELEQKFKQSQDSELREEQQLHGYVLQHVSDVRNALRETSDMSRNLRDKHELLSLNIRSHGTRLSRLKTQYLNA
ncbi:fin bud initiation factor a [Gouania willdenowi]|uniref:Fin bud initiation factor-like n=1 Tax=Gouania willdenowi TaxID=441366 RepID=A0A8C5GKX0_GOUWI|nr:fin bud initiation factor-like [Gouania willdenowi]